jgi:hypothetical protein
VRSYFDATPVIFNEAITYDGSDGGAAPRSYWFPHGMGAIVTAAAMAGFRIERLDEHPHSNREVDYDRYEGRPAQLPLCYTMVLRKDRTPT